MIEPGFDFLAGSGMIVKLKSQNMGAVYYRILNKIERLGYRVFDGRVGLSLPSKIGLVARTYFSRQPTWMEE